MFNRIRKLMKIKFVHVNIVASDWKGLADFYIKVFGCTIKPPERDLSGEWIDSLTGLKNAHITGAHLHLPGYDEHGPTIEIFQYNESVTAGKRSINREGFAHIAFAVDDVEEILKAVIKNGGSTIGGTVSSKVTGAGTLHVVYASDPEGNIIEIQKWG